MTIYEISAGKPKSPLQISVPGSKSYSNRALLIAALASGVTKIHSLLESDDTVAMQNALKALGVKISKSESTVTVHGTGGVFKKPNHEIDLQNAGTAMRFLTCVLAAQPFESIVTGNARMKNRPIKDLVDALREGGARIEYLGTEGYPPLLIKGGLTGGNITIAGEESSQYISGMLIASPLLSKKLILKVKGNLASRPYVDMTIDCMKAFGVTVKNAAYKEFSSEDAATYQPSEYVVEADASSASYFFALAAIHGIEVTVSNAVYNSSQGDIKFVDLLEKLGCEVERNGEMGITIKGKESYSSIGAIDMNTMPDSALTMAIVSAFCIGKTRLTNVPNLRVKECDRILALAQELTKMNCKARQLPDGIEIKGHPHKYHGAQINTYDDHRIAMCFAVIGTKVNGVSIENPECVHKTYPTFWEDLQKCGIKILSK